MITATLSNHRISPRKVRLVADMVRGKSVSAAQTILAYASKKAKHPIATLIASAVANAEHNFKVGKDSLIVSEIRVDQGYTLKRMRPMSRGSGFPIKKRTSHISVVLAPAAPKKAKKAKKEEKPAAKAEKKPANK